MMTALAKVTQVEQRAQDYQLDLTCEQESSCSGCASANSCATGVVSKVVRKKSLLWRLYTQQAVKPGQMVEIGFPEKSLLQSAALVYLLPLFLMMMGAIFADLWLAPWLNMGEGIVILAGFLSLGLGVVIARFWANFHEQASQKEVVLIRVLGEPIV